MVSLLRASAASLDRHVTFLPEEYHLLAVHAAFPTLMSEKTLHVDCSALSTAAAASALAAVAPAATRSFQGATNGVSEQPRTTLLSRLNVSSLVLRCADNAAAVNFTSALCCAVCAAPQHVSITSAEISDQHFRSILAAMAQNSHLETLEIEMFDSMRAREPPLAPVIAHGLSQLTGLRSLALRNMPERTNLHLPRTLQPLTLQATLQSLTLLTQLHLDSSIQCADGIACCLSKLVHLKTLELCIYVYKECHVNDLSVALTHLTALRNLVCDGEGHAVLPALASSNFASLERLDLNLSSGFGNHSGGHKEDLQGLVIEEPHPMANQIPWIRLIIGIANMHELQALSLRLPHADSGTAVLALLDTLRQRVARSTGFSFLMLREVHATSPAAGIMLCSKLATLTTLRHLHLHTCAAFVPMHASRIQGLHAHPPPPTCPFTATDPYPSSHGLPNTTFGPASSPTSAALEVSANDRRDALVHPDTTDGSHTRAGLAYAPIATGANQEMCVGTASPRNFSGFSNSSALPAGAASMSGNNVAPLSFSKGPLAMHTQLTHLTLRESSDWSRLKATLSDFSMPLQPLTAFLLSGLSHLTALRYLEVDDDLQVRGTSLSWLHQNRLHASRFAYNSVFCSAPC